MTTPNSLTICKIFCNFCGKESLGGILYKEGVYMICNDCKTNTELCENIDKKIEDLCKEAIRLMKIKRYTGKNFRDEKNGDYIMLEYKKLKERCKECGRVLDD